MAFEQITNLKSYKKINADSSVQTTQTKLVVENLKTILSASSTAIVTRLEYESDKVIAAAQQKINLLYIDNENAIKSIEKNNEFSFSLSSNGATNFFVDLKERETTIEQLQNGELVATSVFIAEACAVSAFNFSAVTPKNENVFEKTKTIKTQNLSATCQDKFAVSYEGEITASSILASEAKCCLTSVTATEDAIVVDGQLFVSVISEIDGNIKQSNKKIDFSGEAVALGLKKDDIVDANAQVENLVVTLSNTGANATIAINATIGIIAECYSENSTEVIEDAFMENNELLITSQGVEINKISKNKFAIQEKECILQSKDKNANIGAILAVINPKCENGLLTCTVLYRQAETDEIASCIMFAAVEDINSNSKIAITSFSKKRAKELLIEFVALNSENDQSSTYEVFASAIETGCENEKDNKAIVVYSAKKGQCLFDIAKYLKANPAIIKEQNENLEDILSADRKILLYKSAKI